VFENVSFEHFFDGVGKLHARVGEELDAIVLVRIVGSRDHDASLKIILADKASDARSGDDARESHGAAPLRDAGGEESGDVRAGFAGVHADENVCGGVFAKQIVGKRAADSKESGVVEGWCAGNAADSVSAEKLFGHEKVAAKTQEDRPQESLT